MIHRTVFSAIALLFSHAASARPYDEIVSEAQAAYQAEDFETARLRLDEAQEQRPYSLYLTRSRVLVRMLAGRTDEALAIVEEIAARGLTLGLPDHEAMRPLIDDPRYAAIAERMEANRAPVGAAVTSAVYDEAELLPEAISKRKKRILVGSVRSGEIVVAADALQPFAKLDGGVFDIEQTRNTIYAAVNNQLAYLDETARPPFAALVLLDPSAGSERARIGVPFERALIGDIEIDRKGVIYASDSLTPRIFAARPGETVVRILASDTRFVNLQGIALDPAGDRLYVADYLTGIFMVDLPTGAVTAIVNPSGAHLGGIDGLYLHEGDLIGVQNGTTPQRIVRIRLDRTGVIAERLEVLAQNQPAWNEPTHGYVEDGAFHYLATSNWPAYSATGDLAEGAQLSPLRIMLEPLN